MSKTIYKQDSLENYLYGVNEGKRKEQKTVASVGRRIVVEQKSSALKVNGDRKMSDMELELFEKLKIKERESENSRKRIEQLEMDNAQWKMRAERYREKALRCAQENRELQEVIDRRTCFSCGRYGHMAKFCTAERRSLCQIINATKEQENGSTGNDDAFREKTVEWRKVLKVKENNAPF